jgi:hypothetical protein
VQVGEVDENIRGSTNICDAFFQAQSIVIAIHDQICSVGDGTALHFPLCQLHLRLICLSYAFTPFPNSGM